MGKFIEKRINQSTGFTIVELLLVIVIIGILAAITLVSYIGISKRATEAGLTSDLDGAKRQLELYKIEYESYPTILDTNKCPTSPNNDTKYCLKNKDFIYTTTDSGLTYTLKLTKSDITFEVTNDSTPKIAEAAPAEPTLPESDWITVGTQRWARKNLNVGTLTATLTASSDNGIVEKYCFLHNESNCTSYGALYQWNEVMNWTTAEGAQGICPLGSHIPSDNDWKILEMHLGMSQATADLEFWRGTNQGTQLKVGGASGLEIPLAGFRYPNGSAYGNQTIVTLLWSSTESTTNAWLRGLFNSNTNIERVVDNKDYGYSARCLGN